MALWDDHHRAERPRAEASAFCMAVTIGGLIAAAVTLKWLIALVM